MVLGCFAMSKRNSRKHNVSNGLVLLSYPKSIWQWQLGHRPEEMQKKLYKKQKNLVTVVWLIIIHHRNELVEKTVHGQKRSVNVLACAKYCSIDGISIWSLVQLVV